MDFRRLFLNWLKQNDPYNKFENTLQDNNKTLKSHVKSIHCYDHLIIIRSFSWSDTDEGFYYWMQFYDNWVIFCRKWAEEHHIVIRLNLKIY